MVFIKINRNPPDSHKRLFNILPKPYLLNLILIVIIVSTFCNSITAATDNQKFAVYHFRNLTGEDEWQWLERGFSDMLNHAFSQSDKINYITTEEIEKLTNIEFYETLAEEKDISLFRSLNDVLKVDLIFTGYFSLEKKGLLRFNLIMFQAQLDQFFEFREMTVMAEDLFYFKEDIARTILEEAGVYVDEELAFNLKKNISTSLTALKNYYQSIEFKNQAIAEYQGADYPSKPLWSKAIDFGEKAIEKDPSFADAYYLLSQIYERTKWTFREIASLEKYLETTRGNNDIKVSYHRLSDALYRLAYSKYAQEDIASTIDNLEDSVLYQQDNVKARILLMQAYYDTGQVSKALEQAEQIEKIQPENKEVEWVFRQYQQAKIYGKEAYELYVTGYNAYSSKKYFDSIKLLTQSISLSKDFKEAYYFLGLSYYQVGDLDSSIKYLEEAVRLDPFNTNARIYLNKANEEKEFGREVVWIFNQGYQNYIAGDYEAALLKFKESAQKNPNYEKTRIYLMRTYYHLDQMDEYLAEREKFGGDFDIDWEKEYYQLAYNFYSLGDYEAALERLRDVLEDSPDFLEARFLIAETLYQLKNYAEANQHYQFIVDSYVDSEYYENALLGNGWCSYLLGDYSNAEISLELLVKNYPRSPLHQEGIYKLGMVYFKQKEYAQAIKLYENLITIDPLQFDQYEIKFILGQSYFWEGIYDKAKAYFTDIKNNRPDFELLDETMYYHSFVLFKEGNYPEARTNLEELVQKDSLVKDESLYLLARVFLEQKEYDKAIDINSALAEKVDDSNMLVNILFDLGLAYSKKGEDEEAISYYEEMLNQPLDGELSKIVSLELARSYYQLSRYQDVLIILEDSDSKEALELKIDAANKMSNEEDIITLYEEVSSRYPQDPLAREGYFVLAKSKYEKGEFQEAINIFQEIEDMAITDKMRQEINYWKGLSFYRLGDYSQAEDYFYRVDQVGGDEIAIRALYMLGETCYKQEKYSEAIKHYQEFLKNYHYHSLADHVQYSECWSYLNLGDHSMAIDLFNKFIKDYPESQFVEESNFLIGKIHFLAKKNDEARVKLQYFIQSFAKSIFVEEALYILAQINLGEEQWIDSILNFEKLIDHAPSSQYLPGALYGLSLSYFKKGEYEKSLRAGDRYLSEYPSGTLVCDILYITAICEEELGYQERAKEKYEMILQKCPETTYVDSIERLMEQ
jgi:tetratricopeptide (TPR) repeat protein